MGVPTLVIITVLTVLAARLVLRDDSGLVRTMLGCLVGAGVGGGSTMLLAIHSQLSAIDIVSGLCATAVGVGIALWTSLSSSDTGAELNKDWYKS